MEIFLGKATLYVMGAFGFGHTKVEVRKLYYGLEQYANYEEAIVVRFIEKGKRKWKKIVETSHTSLVVLAEWEHPEFEQYVTNSDGSKEGRYESFDSRWDSDFDEFLTNYLNESNAQVIADYRNHKSKPRQIESYQNIDDNSLFSDTPSDANSQDLLFLAEEVLPIATLTEGSITQITVNAYERNSKAREICVAYYGARCVICGFDFATVYGKAGERFIHVHHLKPLSGIGKEYQINPIVDLRPVCPNCHAIIHRRNPAYSIDEVEAMLHRLF